MLPNWCLFSFILYFTPRINSATNQSTLIKDLFKDYYEGAIPRCTGTIGAIPVTIDVALRQIIELNERQQILTLNTWIRLYWTDCQLVWNASDYGGIDTLVLPFQKIWVPDITLYDNNQEGTSRLSGQDQFNAVVTSDGSVRYFFPTVMSSLCKIDATFFPFDTQACPLKFSSWSFDGSQISVINKGVSGDLGKFKMNTEWNIVSLGAARNVIYYSCCPNPYIDVTYTLNISRKSASYVLNLIVPCILITSIALFGFLLPPDSGEKVGLEITVLLALAFFSLVVSEALPPSESVPYVGIYFACSMIMVTLSLLLTVIVLNIHHRGQLGSPVPAFVKRVVFGILSPLVLLKHIDNKVNPTLLNWETEVELCSFTQSPKLKKQVKDEKIKIENSLLDSLKDQLKVLDFFKTRFENSDKDEDMNKEWQNVAIVLDRVFFVLFLIFNVICTIAVILQLVTSR